LNGRQEPDRWSHLEKQLDHIVYKEDLNPEGDAEPQFKCICLLEENLRVRANPEEQVKEIDNRVAADDPVIGTQEQPAIPPEVITYFEIEWSRSNDQYRHRISELQAQSKTAPVCGRDGCGCDNQQQD